MEIPVELKKYFWDTEFEKLDIKKNMKYIISRIFCEENWKSSYWRTKGHSRS